MLHRRPILKITWLGLLLALLGATECEELFELQFVSIDGPAEMTFTKAQSVTITASVLEGEGLTVEEVRFYHDDALASTDRTAPYTHAWPITDRDNGIHRWHAEATYYVGPDGEETLKSDEVMYEVAIPSATPHPDPKVLSTVPIGATPADIAFADGGLAVVAAGNQLLVLDVGSTFGSARVVSSLRFDNPVQSVAAKGAYAYGLERKKGAPFILHVVDLRVPAEPRIVREIQLNGSGNEIAVSENVLAFPGGAGLQVFDVTHPADPRGGVTVAGTVLATSVKVLRGRAYVLTIEHDGRPALSVVDVRSPASPAMLSKDTKFLGTQLYEGGGNLYARYGSLLLSVDLSDPIKPRIGAWFFTGEVTSAAGTSSQVYVVREDRIEIFDVTRPDAHIDSIEDVGRLTAAAVHEGLLYVGGLDQSIMVIDPRR